MILIEIYTKNINLNTIIIMKFAYTTTLEDLTIQLKHVVILHMTLVTVLSFT